MPHQSASTGPRTEAGKAVSSQNARKHDLCSRTLRLLPEEWVEYNDMCERYRRDLKPAGDLEQTLVDEICFNYWRLQQAREVELGMIAEHPTDLPVISLYIRYRTGYERAFYKALERLHKIQADARKQAPAPAPLAAVPLAAGPLAPIPLAAFCSANEAIDLEDLLETHVLENRVRGEFALPPLEVPGHLTQRLNTFVSQNPGEVPEQLLELMKKVA